MTPISDERENISRPDGCMLLKSRTGEGIQWADIALSCEYKVKDGDNQLDDVRVGDRKRLAIYAYHLLRTYENACGACNMSCETIHVVEPLLA
jgi:predicted dithiol-disulfide oxidoreductase (DUF899 family)